MYQLMFKRLSKTILVGLILGLPACHTLQTQGKALPPVEWLADCPLVLEHYRTNGELAETVVAYRKALALCNLDKESLREWAKE